MEKSATSTKAKKEAKDEKQKDHKFEEQVLKSLEGAETVEDKLKLLVQKYVENDRNNRRMRQEQKMQEKQLENVLREKENLQREHNKSILMREKLQEVCREQQKLLKSVKNESMQKIREEEERRKESQIKFQASLNEISLALAKNSEENIKLRDHNLEMTKKLKLLADQYQTREHQLEKLNEQVKLESQLYQAKLSKQQVQAAMEKEIVLKEKEAALEKLMRTQTMLIDLTEREQALKEQLNLYTSKYDDFQSSLQKSNDIFTTYKSELEKMSKNTKKLEKEAMEWKQKWERSNGTVIQLSTEKKDRDDHAARCTRQVEQLQKLLRALQNERTHLYNVLKENKIEAPVTPALPPEPEPIQTAPASNTADKEKMELMTKNCADLKQTLVNLQNQMKYLNLKPNPAVAESKDQTLQRQDEMLKKRQKRKQKGKKTRAASVEDEAEKINETENAEKQEEQQSGGDNAEKPVENSSVINKVLKEIELAVNSQNLVETIAKITGITAEHVENETYAEQLEQQATEELKDMREVEQDVVEETQEKIKEEQEQLEEMVDMQRDQVKVQQNEIVAEAQLEPTLLQNEQKHLSKVQENEVTVQQEQPKLAGAIKLDEQPSNTNIEDLIECLEVPADEVSIDSLLIQKVSTITVEELQNKPDSLETEYLTEKKPVPN